jgi:predicted aminopeptidase
MTTSIEKLGFGKWFRDHIDPADLDRFDIARVMAVHKESYIINNGERALIIYSNPISNLNHPDSSKLVKI